jgi:hypothetical protein
VFKVTAWCSGPNSIPREFKLEIVDPVTTDGGMLRRSTVYPIRVSVKILDRPNMLQSLQPSPPPAEDDPDQGRRRRRRRSRRLSFGITAPRKSSTAAVLPRLSVHQRLGPRVQSFVKEGVRVPRLPVHKRLGPLGIFNAEKGAFKKVKRVCIPKRRLKSSVSVWIPKTSSAFVSPLPAAVDDALLEATSSIVVTEDALAGSPSTVLCQEVIPVDVGACSEAAIISDVVGDVLATYPLTSQSRIPMVESKLQDVTVYSGGVGLPIVESELQDLHLMESSLTRNHLMSPSLLVYSRKRPQKIQLIDGIAENGSVGAAADAMISPASATVLAADDSEDGRNMEQIVMKFSSGTDHVGQDLVIIGAMAYAMVSPATTITFSHPDPNLGLVDPIAAMADIQMSPAVVVPSLLSSHSGEQEDSQSMQRVEFLKSVTRQPSKLLPAPPVILKKDNLMPSRSVPRRSRRVAGVGVEFNASDLDRRATKKIMKAVGIIADNVGID